MKLLSLIKLSLKSALYYKRTGLLVALGLSIAGAVTTGSLIIGDSVKGSIRHSSLARLGRITHAVRINGFATASMTARLAKELGTSISPAIVTKGVVENQNSGETAPIVNIIGIDDSYKELYLRSDVISLGEGSAVVNEALAKDLGISKGDSVLVTVDRDSPIPSSSLFAQVDPVKNQRSMRLEIKSIASDIGPGGFRLDSSTQIPRNIFVSIAELSKAIEKTNKINTLLVSSGVPDSRIAAAVKKSAIAADYGIIISNSANGSEYVIKSDSVAFPDTVLKGILKATEHQKERVISSLYLANSLETTGKDKKKLHYSVIASVDPQPDFSHVSGRPVKDQQDIVLNEWAAKDLNVTVGNNLLLKYLVSQPGGTYQSQAANLRISGIIRLTGPAVNRDLVPVFEGITDADKIGDWQPPFPVDLQKVTDSDELYWEKYKATPKAFLHPDTMRKIWSAAANSSGWVTGIFSSAKDSGNLLDWNITNSIDTPPGQLIPVRANAIRSSQGNTDLAGVFFGLGMLLIYACSALAGSLIRISVGNRNKHAGILLAQGFTTKQTGIIVFLEWATWIKIGALASVPLGVFYAWVITKALNSWWQGAVGNSLLWMSVNPLSLILGFISALLIGFVTLYASIRGFSSRSVIDLLHNRSRTESETYKPTQNSRVLRIGILLLFAGVAVSFINPMYGLILAIPISLPLGVIAANRIVAHLSDKYPYLKKYRVSLRNEHLIFRHDAAAQLAAAAVILLIVSSQVRTVTSVDKESGTGGFALRAISSMPPGYDLSTPEGRAKLGFQPEDEALFKSTAIFSLPAADGDDISCLNLAKPGQPRILGVPEKLAARGGFGLDRKTWSAFTTKTSAIPAIGDKDSVTWNMKKKIVDTVNVTAENGDQAEIKLQGLIKQSLFAGELLVPEKDFVKMFPSKSQPRYFLISCPAEKTNELASLLRQTLGNAGLEVRTTSEIINSYLSVQNTYIAVLMALGGLALILGSGGQVTGIFRSLSQQRNHYAILLAIGFRRQDIINILIAEHAVVPGLREAYYAENLIEMVKP